MSEDSVPEEMRKKRMQEHEQRKKEEDQLKTTLRVVVDENGYQRLLNVKLANEQLFVVASQHILTIFKQVGRKLADKDVLMILRRIKESSEKETKITFARK